MKLIATFLASLSFLSRIPIPYDLFEKYPDCWSKIPRWFTPVGLFLGLLAGSFGLVLSFWIPPLLLAALVLGFQVLLTGCIHEDGLADLADSAGRFELEKKLEIMRDSRLGTYGVLAIVLSSLIRFGSISALALYPKLLFVSLFLSVAFSRTAALPLMRALAFLERSGEKGTGIGNSLEAPTTFRCSLHWVLLTLLASLLLSFWHALLLSVSSAFVVGVFYLYFKRNFNGITGDCLGASILTVECFVLILCSLAL